jgi:RNA recognition motif-containing protein
MSFTVFLGNLPAWVTADDIRGWLAAENLVADAIKVIRNPETQESKGFAFIEAPNTDEMNAIIRRFDRAPLEDRLLRANPAQPPKPKGAPRLAGPAGYAGPGGGHGPSHGPSHGQGHVPSHVASAGSGVAQHVGNTAGHTAAGPAGHTTAGQQPPPNAGAEQRPPRRGKRGGKRNGNGSANSAFAEELAKAL